jgi:hypothetical protein
VDTARLGTETARAKVEEASSAKMVVANSSALPPPESARPLERVDIGPRDTKPAIQITPPPVSVAVPTIPQPVSQAPAITTDSVVKTETVAARMEPAAAAPEAVKVNAEPEGTKMAALPLETAPIPTPAPQTAAKPAFDLGAIVSSIEIPESEQKPGWTASWGKSRRLLVGPFDDMKTAKKWEADFRKAGGDGFAWKSAEGEVIDKLKGK